MIRKRIRSRENVIKERKKAEKLKVGHVLLEGDDIIS